MTKTIRLIFPHGTEHNISHEEYQRLNEPYEQQKKLFKRLAVWTAVATRELEAFGYAIKPNDHNKIIFRKKMPCYDEETGNDHLTLFFYCGAIGQDAAPAERAACEVLKRAWMVWESRSTGNHNLMMNLCIEFGLAVAAAHAMPFEALASIGSRTYKGTIKGGKTTGKQQTEERAEEWKKWIVEAKKIQIENPNLTNKSEIARRVKRNLELKESIKAIINRIFKKKSHND